MDARTKTFPAKPHHEKDYKFHSKKTKPQRNTFTSRGYASSDITT
jgi:hypothetical protein